MNGFKWKDIVRSMDELSKKEPDLEDATISGIVFRVASGSAADDIVVDDVTIYCNSADKNVNYNVGFDADGYSHIDKTTTKIYKFSVKNFPET